MRRVASNHDAFRTLTQPDALNALQQYIEIADADVRATKRHYDLDHMLIVAGERLFGLASFVAHAPDLPQFHPRRSMFWRSCNAHRPGRSVPFPCRPPVSNVPPSGAGWVHEVKYDGCRLQVHVEARRVRLYTIVSERLTARYAGPVQ